MVLSLILSHNVGGKAGAASAPTSSCAFCGMRAAGPPGRHSCRCEAARQKGVCSGSLWCPIHQPAGCPHCSDWTRYGWGQSSGIIVACYWYNRYAAGRRRCHSRTNSLPSAWTLARPASRPASSRQRTPRRQSTACAPWRTQVPLPVFSIRLLAPDQT